MAPFFELESAGRERPVRVGPVEVSGGVIRANIWNENQAIVEHRDRGKLYIRRLAANSNSPDAYRVVFERAFVQSESVSVEPDFKEGLVWRPKK